MKILISPAKTLDLTSEPNSNRFSTPKLLEHSQQLIDTIKDYSPADIASLMKLSDKLSTLNVSRYQEWQQEHSKANSRPAVYTFMGDVYTGLDAYTLSEQDIDEAQQRLRILSGLYGLLKPLDLMQAYRLEMGTKLANSRGKNLYEFWGDIIVEQLNSELAEEELLINLASNEYFKAVNKRKLNNTLITPVFLDEKNGQYKVISFYAKKARGLMARYLIQAPCEDLESVKQFSLAGYRYDEQTSTPNEPVFKRSEEFHNK
ncbi:peroxide stress protein YaaA [Marinomonas epiphytica]